jgi:hypothetical protein
VERAIGNRKQGGFNLADIVELSMQQRERKAEQAKLIEDHTNQAGNEE